MEPKVNINIVQQVDKRKTLQELFEEYLRIVYAGFNIQGEQRRQVKKAFLAGMWIMINKKLTDPDAVAEYTREYQEYQKLVVQGKD